jgi:hypothetical protein
MEILARRFTIITLVMLLFAMAFATLVQQNGHNNRNALTGSMTSCVQSSPSKCVASL